MTFSQFDINFNRFKYTVEESGVRVINKRLFSAAERFVPFEDIGSEIFKEKERKLIWLFISILFLIISLLVFIDRLNGGKVDDGAEIFWLSVSAVFFIIYSFRRKNGLFLFKDDMESGIEFIGTKLYEKRLNQFIKQLLQRRDAYLSNKYSVLDGLTLDETIICSNAAIRSEDGLFLKKLTKHPLEKLIFESEYSDAGKPAGICSITTEKNARDIIARQRERFISEGKYIFISEFSDKEYYVALTGTTSDPYKIMEYAGTNGANYSIETKDIIAKYNQWEMQFGVKPIGIGSDFCECEIINKDIDYKKLAAEVYEFCPDVVEQGTETVEVLEKELKKTGRIFLWWD
ncbi:MAG TPA: DUF4253 domain-containing protein [Cyclobacteriaceae bacterium]|jgi:hypothetical protein|nr:DUF4253 domain-containing protein [Cyclobacteriaceae bacterium]